MKWRPRLQIYADKARKSYQSFLDINNDVGYIGGEHGFLFFKKYGNIYVINTFNRTSYTKRRIYECIDILKTLHPDIYKHTVLVNVWGSLKRYSLDKLLTTIQGEVNTLKENLKCNPNNEYAILNYKEMVRKKQKIANAIKTLSLLDEFKMTGVY